MKKNNTTTLVLELFVFLATFLIIIGVYNFGFSSPKEAPKPIQRIESRAELKPVVSKEDAMTTFVNSYLSDLQSPDWKNKLPTYFPASNFYAAIKSHEKFRKAFADYKITIKHLAFNKNEVILWLKVHAKHVGTYDDNELKNVKPTGKEIQWDEVWNFEVQDGKFVGQGDFIEDGISRMKQLDVKCLPN